MITTWPLASIRPAICDGFGPTTRFSTTELEDGWSNCTVCWLPTLKLCQLMAARWLVWSMVVVAGDCEIVALPATTLPPVGRAFGAGWACAGSARAMTAPAWNVVASNIRRFIAAFPPAEGKGYPGVPRGGATDRVRAVQFFWIALAG